MIKNTSRDLIKLVTGTTQPIELHVFFIAYIIINLIR